MERLWELSAVRFAREMVEIYFSKRVSRSSAEFAYFLILSFFPLLICINAFVGAIHVNAEAILRGLEPFLPPGLLTVVSEYLGHLAANDSPVVLGMGVFMTLFSASAAVRGLMDVMDDIYDRPGYGGVGQIVWSVVISVLMLVTIYLSIVVVFTGNWFFHFLQRFLPFQVLEAFNLDWQWIKYIVLFGFVFLLVFLVYRLTAPLGKPRAPVVTGALIASVALALASMIFSGFIGAAASRYSLVYGSLTTVIITLLWLYLCGNVLILGNVFNCVWYRRKKERETGK